MLETLRNAHNEVVQTFLRLSSEDDLRAKLYAIETLAYKEMWRTNPSSIRDKTPLQEPEETDAVYKMLADPLNED